MSTRNQRSVSPPRQSGQRRQQKPVATGTAMPSWLMIAGIALALVIMFAVGSFALSQKGLLAVVGNQRLTQEDFNKLVSYYFITDPYTDISSDMALNDIYYDFITTAARLQLAAERGISADEAEARLEFERLKSMLEIYYLIDLADDHELEYDFYLLVWGLGDEEEAEAERVRLETALGTTGEELLANAYTTMQFSDADFIEFTRRGLIVAALDREI